MNIVFKVGPLQSDKGSDYAYFVYPGVEGNQVFFGNNEKSVFERILTIYPADSLVGESQLSGACREFGIASRDLTPDEGNYLGLVTLDLVWPQKPVGVKKPASIYQFATGSAFYYEHSPWANQFSRETIGLVLTGASERTLYARILGAGIGTPGLALYQSAEAIDHMIALFEKKQVELAVNIDTLGVTLENGPGYAVDAMKRAYGLPKLPVPLKLVTGKYVNVDDLDLLILAAALRAVASLAPGSKTAHSEVGVDNEILSLVAYVEA